MDRVWQDDRLIEYYEYGKQGERLVSDTLHSGEIIYVYDDKLRLIQAGDTSYTYNAYGSLAEKKDNNQITKYEYLSNGQLCKVVLPDGRIIEYVFDKRGVRTAKKVNGKVVEKYIWKDFSTLEAITDSKGKNIWTFNHDEDASQIVAVFEGKKFYLASDQVGSVFMVADDQGNEVKRIIYDSFGNVLIDTKEQLYLPLGFASGLTDKDTGLVHFGFREYDPEVGRFTAQDPLGYGGGDVDVYGYCWDDPINFVDREGLKGKSGDDSPSMPPDEEIRPEKKAAFPFWTVTPKANACEKCQALKGKTFKDKPQRPHPNCKCEIELHAGNNLKRTIVGTLTGFSDMAHLSFKARGDVRVYVRNSGPAIIGGVDIKANGGHGATHLRIGGSEEFVFSSLTGDPENWKVRLMQLAGDNTNIDYRIEYYDGEIQKR